MCYIVDKLFKSLKTYELGLLNCSFCRSLDSRIVNLSILTGEWSQSPQIILMFFSYSSSKRQRPPWSLFSAEFLSTLLYASWYKNFLPLPNYSSQQQHIFYRDLLYFFFILGHCIFYCCLNIRVLRAYLVLNLNFNR